MKRPKKIRIGSVTYTILWDAEAIQRESDNNGVEGSWTAFSAHDDLTIGINPNHHLDVQRQAVIHEVMH